MDRHARTTTLIPSRMLRPLPLYRTASWNPLSLSLMDSQALQQQPHALLVPGPGIGHINGLVALAKPLLASGFSLTCVFFSRSFSFHSKHNRLHPLPPSIRVHVLPDGLPAQVDSYVDLFQTTPAMHHELAQLLRALSLELHPVSCIVSDSLRFWTQDIADQFHIPRIEYWTAPATVYSAVLSLPELVSKGYIPDKETSSNWKSVNPVFLDCVVGAAGFPLDEVPREFRAPGVCENFLQAFLPIVSHARRADRILIHSLYELESNVFDGLREAQIPVYAVGPLIHHTFDSTPPALEGCVSWLDKQAHASVIYISFGSNATLSAEEITELAFGIEASGQPFLWVIRSDAVKGELSGGLLPEGVEERTQGRGLIVSWAPQVAVLGHAAVGGFLTHCGWNSTLESLWMGVTMLGCPRGAEQRTNARFIEKEWGVGMELGRTKEGGFLREEVERKVKALMVGEEGKQARKKVLELREVVRKGVCQGGSSHTTLAEFAEDMKTLGQT